MLTWSEEGERREGEIMQSSARATINFHHYIVDELIWKVRRPSLRKTLGIAG